MLRMFGCTSREKKNKQFNGSLNCDIGLKAKKILRIEKAADFMFAYKFLLELQDEHPSTRFSITYNGIFKGKSGHTTVFIGLDSFKRELSKEGLFDESLISNRKPLRPSGKPGCRC